MMVGLIHDTMAVVKTSLAQVIVGQSDVIEGVLMGLLAGGHVLLEGMPGLGKTLLVTTLGQALALDTSRVQGMPDLEPRDLLGTRELHGPIFTNLLLLDEINRAQPKVQAAMLEAMQERAVTLGGVRLPLPAPFVVIATQNPVDQQGTYQLPEAQVDRFLLKYIVAAPSEAELQEIARRTTQGLRPALTPVLDLETLLTMQAYIRDVPIPESIITAVCQLVLGTDPESPYATPAVQRFVLYGSSPRGVQAVLLAAKVHAVLDGRETCTWDDVTAVAIPTLQHRPILAFEGASAGILPHELITGLLVSMDATRFTYAEAS